MVDAVTATTTTTTGTSALTELSEDYDRFISLLTAQIEYQDPLEPMDSSQYVTQLAQLSQVEQSVKTNDNLELLSGQINALVAVAGTDLVGKSVTIQSEVFNLEDGSTDALYRVEEGTDRVVAEIRNADDELIRTIENLSTDSTELQELVWDGLDDAGNLMLNGEYTMSVMSYDMDDNLLTTYTYRTSTVEEVLYTGGSNYYNLSTGEQVAAEEILAAS